MFEILNYYLRCLMFVNSLKLQTTQCNANTFIFIFKFLTDPDV